MTPELLVPLTKAGLASATAFGVTLSLTPLIRSVAVRWGWVTKPVEDRWGKRVIARLGGVALFFGFLAATLLWVPLTPSVISVLGGVGLVFALGLVDDLRRMRPHTKLIVQLLIGCALVISGIRITLIHWAWLAIPLSVLWFVLIVNAFNLLDNMDGLAAGVGAIAAGFCALHAALAHQWTIMTMAAIVSGCCLGFLRYNVPPAKIFMGDSGSHLLGLSLAALALIGSWRHSTQLLSVLAVPTFLLAVPIFDTCFVTLQRLTHQQHPFAGGTDHVSHRLAILGLSTRQTVMALCGISFCLGVLSVVSVALKPLAAAALWLFVLTCLVLFGRYLAAVNVYQATLSHAGSRRFEIAKPETLIETMLLHKRRLAEILVDFSLVSSAYVLAYALRFEGGLTGDLQRLIIQSLPLILIVKFLCFIGCGLYRGIWRYLGLSDILIIFKAVTGGSILSSLALLYLWRFEGYSRTVMIIDWMVCLLAIGGSRVVERLLDEWIGAVARRGAPVLIIGAGDTGVHVLRFLKLQEKEKRRVVGFLDDDAGKRGNRILGAPVLGGREALSDVLKSWRVQEVLVAINDPPGELLEHVRVCCEPQGIRWKLVNAGVFDAA